MESWEPSAALSLRVTPQAGPVAAPGPRPRHGMSGPGWDLVAVFMKKKREENAPDIFQSVADYVLLFRWRI